MKPIRLYFDMSNATYHPDYYSYIKVSPNYGTCRGGDGCGGCPFQHATGSCSTRISSILELYACDQPYLELTQTTHPEVFL